MIPVDPPYPHPPPPHLKLASAGLQLMEEERKPRMSKESNIVRTRQVGRSNENEILIGTLYICCKGVFLGVLHKNIFSDNKINSIYPTRVMKIDAFDAFLFWRIIHRNTIFTTCVGTYI